ncbi:MAG: hypothetical protein HYX50_00100 [Chloroflexi bacterium]|nr:hypothetical protein [Chloroflexota bacterium]
MRRSTPALLLLLALISSLAFSACRSQKELFPKVISLGKGEVFPSILNVSLAVGENRVSFDIIDRDDNRVLDATMRVDFYDLNGPKPVFLSGGEAASVPIDLSYVDEQSDKETSITGRNAVYIAQANFPRAGDFGALISIARGSTTYDPIPYRFNVLDRTLEPMIGEPAPPSRQLTTADVADITEIDSSYPPRPGMHNQTVADALLTRKPTVIAFATPAFCRSRTCGPVMDTVMDPLFAAYGDRASFIHIEPYDLAALRQSNQQQPVQAMTDWNLTTEPWVFVVDRNGRVAAKFEGISSRPEVEAALLRTLGEAPVPSTAVPGPTTESQP